MTLIERHIFARAGLAALMVLGSLAGVVWIIQALKELDVIATKGQTVIAYLALTTLAIPMLLLAVIPIALLLATVFTINAMNANSELVVLNASGASGKVLARPLLVVALLCSLFAGLVGHFVSPWSLLTLKAFATQMRADLVQIIVREGAFTPVEPGLIFHVAKREPGGALSGILISDEREAGKSILFTAERGYVSRQGEQALILLRNGEIQQREAGRAGTTVIRYDSYVFDLSAFAAKVEQGRIRPKERTTPELFAPDPEDSYWKERPGLYRAQIHERFAEMLWPFAYVMVILAFAGQARSNRQSHGSAIGAGMLVVTLLRGAGFQAVGATKGDGSALLVYALPLSAIVVGAWLLATGRQAQLSPAAQARVDAGSLWLEARLAAWLQRLSGRRLAGGARS